MLKRIITAIVAIAIFIPVLWFSDTVVFAIALSLLSLVAVLEMLRCTDFWRHWVLTVPLALGAAAAPVAVYFLRAPYRILGAGALALVILAIYALAVMTFSRGKITISDMGGSLMAVVYVIAAFAALAFLRYSVNAGKYVYLICFIGAWVTDTFAYFTGMLLGKHKLIPDVSPKKTIEGSIGGILFCVAAMVGYGYIVTLSTDGAVTSNYVLLAVSGLFISIVSQIGDLLMSAIKRTYGIKVYGKLFPGHGGVLDRFDSVLAVALVLMVITAFGNLITVAAV